MSAWTVLVFPSAKKAMDKMPASVRARLRVAIEALGENPHGPNSRKLAGWETRWRVRVGDYRIIYDVDGGRLVIEVVHAAHRREVYRGY